MYRNRYKKMHGNGGLKRQGRVQQDDHDRRGMNTRLREVV